MNTREEILKYLATHACANAEELSQILAKTRANIQYHLQQLEHSGSILQVQPAAKSTPPGRPPRFFALAQSQRPSNLVQLAGALLNHLQASAAAPAELTSLLGELADSILHLPGEPSLATVRLNRLIRELSNRGYQARWEAHAGGPAIVLRNCPYAALITKHPELCQMDALILEKQLGCPVTQRTRIQLPGVSFCEFLSSERLPAAANISTKA